jgi:hypothetical protein
MHRITGFLKNTVASVTALTVFLMFVFVGLLAVVIDLGHIHAIKNELQNAADSGALAGARGLYRPDLDPDAVTEDLTPDCSRAVLWAKQAVESNWADKTPLNIDETIDIQVGHWDLDERKFTPVGGCPADGQINAVQVLTRKDDIANLPVTMGFANFLGIANVDVRAKAVGYISWASGVEVNQCILPVALPCCGEDCLEIARCPEKTRFISAQTDNAVWTTFANHPASANKARCQLSFCGDAFEHYNANATEDCPLTEDGEVLAYGTEIYPIDGQVSSVLKALYDLFIDVLNNHDNEAYQDKFTWFNDPVTGELKPAWNTAVMIVDSCPDVYASHPLVVKEVLCFTLYDIRVDEREEMVTINGTTYDYRYSTKDPSYDGPGYIDGCVMPNDTCLMNAPSGATSGVISVRPKLVE